MRKTETITVEKEITIYKCDFCDYTTVNNRGCCGVNPIMKCELCSKDICRKHRNSYFEFDGDYPTITVCNDCNILFSKAWNWATTEYDYDEENEFSIYKMAIRKFKELKQSFENWNKNNEF